MSSQHGHLPDPLQDIWSQHAPIIRRLYEAERKTLKEVKSILETGYGFSNIPLSTYETKLRDELGLRKKLKKGDWSIIYNQWLKGGRRPIDVYVNDSRIPWRKAWKEIRRSGARTANQGGDRSLPIGVVVRALSPVGQAMMLSPTASGECELANTHNNQRTLAQLYDTFPVLNTQRQSPSISHELPQASPMDANDGHSHALMPQQIITSGINPMIRRGISQTSQWTYGGWTAEFLQTIPMNNFKYKLESIINDVIPGTKISGMADGSYIWSQAEEIDRTPSLNLLGFQGHGNPFGVPSVTFDSYYYLTKAMYLLSNRLVGLYESEQIAEIFEDLFNRVSRPVLRKVLKNDIPTIRTAWEATVRLAKQVERKDIFLVLMEVGADHHQWILDNGDMCLSVAAFMDCPDIIRDLLAIGVCPYGSQGTQGTYNTYLELWRPAILEAALSGSLQCVQLLIDVCDINQLLLADRATGFESYVLALENRLPISEEEMQRMKNATLGNKVHSQILDVFLENGANVDSLCGEFILHSINGFYDWEEIVETSRLTLLEFTFYSKMAIYHRLLPYSTKPSHELTRIGVCTAAKSGADTLRHYLRSRIERNPVETDRFLEIILAEQFLYQDFRIDSAIIQALVENGVDVTLPSLRTEIHDLLCGLTWGACKYGVTNDTIYCLKLLLRQGAVINSHVLLLAVGRSGFDTLQLLFKYGLDIKDKSVPALVAAARLNNYEAVSWLLREGVNINGKVTLLDRRLSVIAAALSNFYKTSKFMPIPVVSTAASVEMLRHLVNMGARIGTQEGSSPSDFFSPAVYYRSSAYESAYGKGRVQLTQFIIDSWPDPRKLPCFLAFSSDIRGDTSDERYSTSLYQLLSQEWIKAFELMFKRGCLTTGSSLADLIYHGGEGKLIHQVLDAGGDIKEYSQPFYLFGVRLSPIQAAAHRGDQELVSYLSQRGADIHQVAYNHSGRTAFQAVCEIKTKTSTEKASKMRLFRFFIDYGIDVNEPPAEVEGMTASGAVAFHGEIENAALLVACGADPNTCFNSPSRIGVNKNRCRPLDAAAQFGRLDMIQFLLNVGGLSACMGSTGYDGAITLAQRRGYHTAASLIRQKVAEINSLGRNPHLARGQRVGGQEDDQDIEDVVWSWPRWHRD